VRLPGLRKPHTGDIIVFQFPGDPSVDYIKRCIATEDRPSRSVTSRCS
jgi:hypothetical protein